KHSCPPFSVRGARLAWCVFIPPPPRKTLPRFLNCSGVRHTDFLSTRKTFRRGLFLSIIRKTADSGPQASLPRRLILLALFNMKREEEEVEEDCKTEKGRTFRSAPSLPTSFS